MQLAEVTTPELVKTFHEVPFILYRKNDPQWIPALKQDVEKLFDPEKNKLFSEGGKAKRWILFDENKKAIGRVAAFVNPRTLHEGKIRTGGLGFFDCIDSQEAADILFDCVKNYLKDLGMEAMDGPINFGDRQQFWGCQVSNWQDPPIYPMNYSPVYAHRLFENYGFQVYFRQFVYHRKIDVKTPEIFLRKVRQIRDSGGLRMTDIRGMSMEKVAEDFRTVYNNGWGGHSHFRELTEDASRKIMKAMKPAIDPEVIYFVYYQEKPVAFYVSLPELNQIFRYVNGDLNWLGKLKFLYHKLRRTPDRLTGLVFGVDREWHGKGLEAMMIVLATELLVAKGQYKDTVLAWVGDFNPKMIRVVENLGTSVYREFNTYRYLFDRNMPFERAPEV